MTAKERTLFEELKTSQAGNVTAASVTHQAVNVTLSMSRNKSVWCCCVECQCEFFSSRHDTRFCSANCRKQASRRKERIKREVDNAIVCLLRIERVSAQYPDTNIVASLELERLKNRLSETLAAVTDKHQAILDQ